MSTSLLTARAKRFVTFSVVLVSNYLTSSSKLTWSSRSISHLAMSFASFAEIDVESPESLRDLGLAEPSVAVNINRGDGHPDERDLMGGSGPPQTRTWLSRRKSPSLSQR